MGKGKVLIVLCLFLIFGSINCFAGSVMIHRDHYGVPHIYSGSIEGLFYGWGYASAQDRLFQLEMCKRTYYGQVAELFGEDYVASDLYWRTEYPTIVELETEFNHLDTKYQTIITSYTAGINAWIDEVQKDPENKLPLEFYELGLEPSYWTEMDVAASIMANLGLFMDLTNELINMELYAYLQDKFGEEADDYFNDMVWIEDSSAYTTIEDGVNGEKLTYASDSQLDKLNFAGVYDFSKNYLTKDKRISLLISAMGYEVPKKIQQNATEAMSYCVVVSPEQSETDKTFLMAGPQVTHWLPALVYEVGLHGAGFDTLGTALIGSPYLMFGATSTTAFSCTAGADNIVDIYEEKLNPNNPDQYWYKGEWRDMEIRTEELWVKGETEPRIVSFYRTIHGPIIYTKDTDEDGQIDVAYSKKTACFDSYLSAVASYTELSQAQNLEEFSKASTMLDPALNYFYSDNQGNIAYYHGGKFPIRPEGIDPRFPTPGTGEYEWLGFMSKDEQPSIVNPSSGYLLNWNNKPIAGYDNGDLTGIFTWGCWSEDHRSFTLEKAVKDRLPIGRKDMEDIVHIIADTDMEAVAIKDYLVLALKDATDPQLIKARNLLAEWDNLRSDIDNDGFYDTPAITIFQEWWPIVNRNAFADELDQYWDHWYNFGGLLDNYGGYSFFRRTVMGEEAAVPVIKDYYNGIGWKKVFVDSLKEAISRLEEQYDTSDMDQWIKEIKMMPHPPTHIAGAPTSFGSVPEIKYMDRGSQNHIVEGTWPFVTGENICPPGQSGFININGEKDRHFQDQLEMFANWQYKDMLLQKGDVLINSESTDILIYNPKNWR